MSYINRVVIVGRLTRDPELRHTQGGTAVIEFSIAVNDREKNSASGEWEDRANFFDVTAWGNLAETCSQYLAKGRLTGVDGSLRQDRWDDRETGQKRSKVKIVAQSVEFLDKPDSDAAGGGHTSSSAQQQAPPDDDIPF